jgi:hypothetical protein
MFMLMPVDFLLEFVLVFSKAFFFLMRSSILRGRVVGLLLFEESLMWLLDAKQLEVGAGEWGSVWAEKVKSRRSTPAN